MQPFRVVPSSAVWSTGRLTCIYFIHYDSAGTLLAADMRGGCKGRWLEGAVAAMLQSNGEDRKVVKA